MGNKLRVDLYVAQADLTVERVRSAIEALSTAGFAIAETGNSGALQPPRPLPEALAAFEARSCVLLDARAPLVPMREREPIGWPLILSFEKDFKAWSLPDQEAPVPLGRVGVLSCLSWVPDPWYPAYWLAWVALLAQLVPAVYGWSGDEEGLNYSGSSQRHLPPGIAALEPQEIEWCTILGPAYVARIGLERLLAAPAWRVQVLANGSVLLVLGPQPYEVTTETAVQVAEHIGFRAESLLGHRWQA